MMNVPFEALPREYSGIYVGGLTNILETDPDARTYYQGLPQEVREALLKRSDEVNSPDQLRQLGSVLLGNDN